MNGLAVFPIGHVRSSNTELGNPDRFKGTRSQIHLDHVSASMLEGLEPGMDILVLFWCDSLQGSSPRVHPRGDRSRPLKGVLATCSPQRPNPIGVTRCTLEDVKDTVLYVRDLDAVDGTPVLDIKPFIYGGEGHP